MEIINNVLFRTPDKDHFLSNMITWPDNSNPNAWYYEPCRKPPTATTTLGTLTFSRTLTIMESSRLSLKT